MSHFCLSFIIPSSESLDIGIEVRVTSDPRLIKGAKGKREEFMLTVINPWLVMSWTLEENIMLSLS